MVTNERKQETCNKYREYLRVINIIGNKIILQKHLMAISINLGIVKDEFAFIRDIRELEKNEIIIFSLCSKINPIFLFFPTIFPR